MSYEWQPAIIAPIERVCPEQREAIGRLGQYADMKYRENIGRKIFIREIGVVPEDQPRLGDTFCHCKHFLMRVEDIRAIHNSSMPDVDNHTLISECSILTD